MQTITDNQARVCILAVDLALDSLPQPERDEAWALHQQLRNGMNKTQEQAMDGAGEADQGQPFVSSSSENARRILMKIEEYAISFHRISLGGAVQAAYDEHEELKAEMTKMVRELVK